jgi:hypothetical protein
MLYRIIQSSQLQGPRGLRGPPLMKVVFGRLSRRRRAMTLQREAYIVKGTVSRDFLLMVF